MKPINNKEHLLHYQQMVNAFALGDEVADGFAKKWISDHEWKVVPVEDVGHFNPEQKARISAALCNHGVRRCVAVATEPLGDYPSCFELQPTEEDLELFNQECGLFRYVLTSEDRSWAISCTESYNLFAAKPDLLVSLLGMSIEQARGEFAEFVSTPSIDPNGLLRAVAGRYEAL